MTKISLFCFLTCITVTTFSCKMMHCLSKESFISEFSNFVDEVEKKRMDGNSDWSSVDVDFKDYMDRCYIDYKNEMTIDEKKTIWKKTLKYYYNRYDKDFTAAYKDAKTRFSKEFNEDLNLILNDADQDFKDIFNDLFKEDLKTRIDEIMGGLNEWGEKLKKTIDDLDKESK